MSSHHPPSNVGQSRYPPRDRSPPGLDDRRSSTSYGGSLAARITEPAHRPNDAHPYPVSGREFSSRGPPRGPKAQVLGVRGSAFTSRGRGFSGRGDFRDREFRDTRDAPPLRREGDRDGLRRDHPENRERRVSPLARARSRSPFPRESRDARDLPSRDMDLTRVRRDSRDGPLSATSSVSDAPLPSALRDRGAFRGRGRGEWDARGRGRSSFLGDRDVFRSRSRSRERTWDRNPRENREHVYERREEGKQHEREDREREAERYKRDKPPFRPDSRNSSGPQTAPSTPHSQSTPIPSQVIPDRSTTTQKGPVSSAEIERRPSISVAAISTSGNFRDSSSAEIFSARLEASRDRYGGSFPKSPPVPGPQVPAFGSMPTVQNPSSNSQSVLNEWGQPPASQRSEHYPTPGNAPNAPKAQHPSQPPTGPRAEQGIERRIAGDQVDPGYGRPDDVRGSYVPLPTRVPATFNASSVQNSGSNGYIPLQSAAQPKSAPIAPFTRSLGVPSVVPKSDCFETSKPHGTETADGYGRNIPGNTAAKTTPMAKQSTAEPSSQPAAMRIPTGPRAERAPLTMRQPAPTPVWVAPAKPPHQQWQPQARGGSLQWLRPGLPTNTPRAPSIMSSLPAKRDYAGAERARSASFDQAVHNSQRGMWAGGPTPVNSQPTRPTATEQQHGETVAKDDQIKQETPRTDLDVLNISVRDRAERSPSAVSPVEKIDVDSVDVNDEDETMDLDEEDYNEAERKFEHDMKELNAQRPATPRHHPVLLELLEELDALASAADDFANGISADMAEQEATAISAKTPLGLPSPKSENVDDVPLGDGNEIILREDTLHRSKTPPIESLPFLISAPLTPFSDLGALQENIEQHERIKEKIREEVANRRQEVVIEFDRLKKQYSQLYKPWRLRVIALDEQGTAEKAVTSTPPSPVATGSPVVTPAPIIEGRRAGKFDSELDLQRALKESAQAAKEEEERRAQEAEALADTHKSEKEAIIPDMLDHYQREIRIFKDTNQLVDARLALDVFAFVPPQDNFTPEEQKVFMENFLFHPKKWGKIAEALPGRDYKQCIEHYYLTKEEAKYKLKLSRRWNKKGRKTGRAIQTRPKSNALMSDLGARPDLYDGDEFDSVPPQTAVTDTGRPKRAAAPVFGEVSIEADPVTPMPTPGRRGGVTNRGGELTGEHGSERPATKRTKTTQGRGKGSKPVKASLLAAAPGPSPQKSDREEGPVRNKPPKLEDEQRVQEFKEKEAHFLANLQMGQAAGITTEYTVHWPGGTRTSLNLQSQTPRQQIQQQQQAPQLQHELSSQQQRNASQTSSYWSVPEQQDFYGLVAHFGTDWQAIANYMKSKTHIMVC